MSSSPTADPGTRALALPLPGPGWEVALERAEQLGVGRVHITLAWDRGADDDAVFDDWGRALDAVHDRGLQPILDLGARTPPASFGIDAWRHPPVVDEFAAWVDRVTARLAGRCHHWVTVPPPAVTAADMWLAGIASGGRRLDVAATIRTIDHLFTAHVLAYDAIHARQPQATVALAHHPIPVYEFNALGLDVLLARHEGVARYDLPGHLSACRRGMGAASTLRLRAVRRWARNAVPMEKSLPRLIAAVYDGAHDRPVDAVHLFADHSDPLHHFKRHRDRPGAVGDASTLRPAVMGCARVGLPVWLAAGGCAFLPLDVAEATAESLRNAGATINGVIIDESSAPIP